MAGIKSRTLAACCGDSGKGEPWFLTARAPLDFIPPSWKPYVCSASGQIDRPLWEICLLDQLRQALKGGNLNVAHSRAFQPLETYLL